MKKIYIYNNSMHVNNVFYIFFIFNIVFFIFLVKVFLSFGCWSWIFSLMGQIYQHVISLINIIFLSNLFCLTWAGVIFKFGYIWINVNACGIQLKCISMIFRKLLSKSKFHLNLLGLTSNTRFLLFNSLSTWQFSIFLQSNLWTFEHIIFFNEFKSIGSNDYSHILYSKFNYHNYFQLSSLFVN